MTRQEGRGPQYLVAPAKMDPMPKTRQLPDLERQPRQFPLFPPPSTGCEVLAFSFGVIGLLLLLFLPCVWLYDFLR
jgi:hypothetical protein